jgi:hypothetical protein
MLEGDGFMLEDDLSCAFAFDPAPGKLSWASLPPPAAAREAAAVVRDTSGGLLAIGGTSPDFSEPSADDSPFAPLFLPRMRTLGSVERLDSMGPSATWRAMPSLRVARCCTSAAVHACGDVYAVGGGESMYRGAACLTSVEVLRAGCGALTGGDADAADGWCDGPSLSEARCALGVALSYKTSTLYAVGGYAGAMSYLSSAEALDVGGATGADARWRALPAMSVQRAGPNACVGPDGRVYVVGGGPDGKREWNTMEALDARMASWDTALAHLHYGRHYNAAAFGPDGWLYVSGGFRHTGQLDAVERYDPRANKWEQLSNIGFVVKFSAGAFVF